MSEVDFPQMELGAVQLDEVEADPNNVVQIARSRRFAAALTLLFLAILSAIFAYYLSQMIADPSELPIIGGGKVFLGAAALIFAVYRYTLPAIRALRFSKPVYLKDRKIYLFDECLGDTRNVEIDFGTSRMKVMRNGDLETVVPAFFIRPQAVV